MAWWRREPRESDDSLLIANRRLARRIAEMQTEIDVLTDERDRLLYEAQLVDWLELPRG